MNKLIKHIFLFIIMLVFFFYAYSINSFIGIYLGYASLIVYCMVFIGENVLAPSTWLIAFYGAYTLPYPIFIIYVGQVDDYAFQMMFAKLLGLAGIVLGLVLVPSKGERSFILKADVSDKYLTLLINALFILLIIGLTGAAEVGHTSKREFLDAQKGGVVALLGLFLPYTYVFGMRLLRNSQYNERIFLKIDLIYMLPFIIAFLLIGERDILFRVLLIVFFIYFTFLKKITPTYFYLIIVCFVFILPLTQEAKALLVNSNSLSFDIDIGKVLFCEFSAASRNLHFIIKNHHEILYGESFIWDLKRVFSIFFDDSFSTGYWFNEVYRKEAGYLGTSGWGFSLLAQGVLNFGLFGAFSIYFLITVNAQLFYNNAYRSEMWLITYMIYISAVIYCQRADLANYINQAIKIPIMIGLVVITFFYIYRFLTQPFTKRDNLV